jgi:hypothetical protein
VHFYSDSIDIRQITKDADYKEPRMKIGALVGGDRRRLQIDIGWGDRVIGGPIDRDYLSLLEFGVPNIRMYSIESSIAEKLEAIVRLGRFGSRMKDYFDVAFIMGSHIIDKKRLKQAIHATFAERSTPLEDIEHIFSGEFKNNVQKQRQWDAFLQRSSIESDQGFDEIVAQIERSIDFMWE